MLGKELRLLALDGGGARGLSTLMILEQLMDAVNPDSPPKPCDYFDMIGGTSTGGLIAIMLGRLKMSVHECIDAYISLSDRVFQKKRHRVTVKGNIQGRFDSEELAQAVKEIITKRGLLEDALLKDSPEAICKVFVCATSKKTSETVCLTSYQSPRGGNDLLSSVTIWEACRATSAASSFFDDIAIGRYKEVFVDGATGANNPVWELWNQAQAIWGSEPLEGNIKCLVSVGTGVPSLKSFHDDIFHIGETLVAITTETEQTAERFRRDKSRLDNSGRYYRFNVAHGLEEIGLEESKKINEIAAATRRYIGSQDVFKQIQACVDNLARTLLQNRDNKGRTGLHMASESGDIEQIAALLRGGADIDAEDNDCKTPLHLAAQSGEKATVNYLLKMGAKIHGADGHHQQALHLAAQRGHEEVIFSLLLGGANINARDASGRTALHYAVVNRYDQVLKVLLKEGADVTIKDKDCRTAFSLAREGGLKTAQELLLTPSQKQKLSLEMTQVIVANDLTRARELLDEGVDPNLKFGMAPAVSKAMKSPEMTKLLLERGADANSTTVIQEPLLFMAIMIKEYATMKVILEAGGDANRRNSKGSTPLHIAVRLKDYVAIEALLERGVDVNAKDRLGKIPIFYARSDNNILKLFQTKSGQEDLPIRQPTEHRETLPRTESSPVASRRRFRFFGR